MGREPSSVDTEPAAFDQVLDRLRVVVDKLEGGEMTLEQSLACFEEGVRLSRRGAEMLDAAERRVDILLRAEDGALKTEPFRTDTGESR